MEWQGEPPVRTTPDGYHFHVYDYQNSQPWTLSPGQPGRNNLQFYSMVQDLNGLFQYGQQRGVPNIQLQNIGATISGDDRISRNIYALSFGGTGDRSTTPSVLITGGIHAREWIAPEIAYLIAEYLIKNYPGQTERGDYTEYQKQIKKLVDSRSIHILPMLNPNGNYYTVFSPDNDARLWRKNRRRLPFTGAEWKEALDHPPFINVKAGTSQGSIVSYSIPSYSGNPPVPPGNAKYTPCTFLSYKERFGVDLNRNFPTAAWGYYNDKDDFDPKKNSDSYFGPQKNSETETAAIVTYIRAIPMLRVSIDYHSFGQMILYPTEAMDNNRVTPQYEGLGIIMQKLTQYELGSPFTLLGYNGVGSLMDFASSLPNVFAFTIEMDPAKGDPNGFVLAENQIQMVFEKNILAALAAIAAAGGDNQAALPYCTWEVAKRGNQLPQ